MPRFAWHVMVSPRSPRSDEWRRRDRAERAASLTRGRRAIGIVGDIALAVLIVWSLPLGVAALTALWHLAEALVR